MARHKPGGPPSAPRPYSSTGGVVEIGEDGKPLAPANRSTREAVTIGAVMEKAVADVMHMRNTLGFKGVVDVSVELNSTQIDETGWIGVIIGGNDSTQSTTRVKLATRVYLDDAESHEPR